MRNRVLFITANTHKIHTIQAELQRYGLTVETLNIKRAIEAIQVYAPAAIVLDIDHQHADIDRYQVCQQIASNPMTDHIPVILLIPSNERNMLIEPVQTGAYDSVTRDSFAIRNLIEVMRTLKLL
jgi:CheY-like chemotaxis protein